MSEDAQTAAAEASSSRPSKKRPIVEDLAAEWGLSLEEAWAFSAEHITALQNFATLNQDAEVAKEFAAEEGGEDSQRKQLFRFKEEIARKKKIGNILDKMDLKRYADVHERRINPDPIIRVRCTKPKKDKILTMHITRNGPSHR